MRFVLSSFTCECDSKIFIIFHNYSKTPTIFATSSQRLPNPQGLQRQEIGLCRRLALWAAFAPRPWHRSAALAWRTLRNWLQSSEKWVKNEWISARRGEEHVETCWKLTSKNKFLSSTFLRKRLPRVPPHKCRWSTEDVFEQFQFCNHPIWSSCSSLS